MMSESMKFIQFNLNQIAQDVPRYMMVAGDRAELRGLNLEGLKRNGFSDQEVSIYF
jgi:acyl-[acyl carrier protein]--UDP-N-acetylglucosamine O-acyltransferase